MKQDAQIGGPSGKFPATGGLQSSLLAAFSALNPSAGTGPLRRTYGSWVIELACHVPLKASPLTHRPSVPRRMAHHPFFQYPRRRSYSSKEATLDLRGFPSIFSFLLGATAFARVLELNVIRRVHD